MRSKIKQATIVTDLMFGDSGKGSLVDYLVRQTGAKTVVRFSGGPQAGHNVVLADGRRHNFHQLGAGGFVPGIRTHLSRFMLISPYHLMVEVDQLARLGPVDALNHLTIDRDCKVITPYHISANRLREILRGGGRHGSCGLGIGETMKDSIDRSDETIYARHLADPLETLARLEEVRSRKLAEFSARRDEICALGGQGYMADLEDEGLSVNVAKYWQEFAGRARIVPSEHLTSLLSHGHVVFEGAQGVLLDEWYGFHPYTTWSTTTNANAEQLLLEAGYDGEINRLGLLRGYSTRHGAGPFPTESPALSEWLIDPGNPRNDWQEGFRVGQLDLVLARYALSVAGQIDGLVVSCLDPLEGLRGWSYCESYSTPSGAVSRLDRSPTPDLDYQFALMKLLQSSDPVLTDFKAGEFTKTDVPTYLEMIAEKLALPVAMYSSGPTAEDKHQLISGRIHD